MADQTSLDIANNSLSDKKPLTFSEYKTAMRTFFTQRNQEVVACKHKLPNESIPKTNCQGCWWAFFYTSQPLVETSDLCFRQEGEAVLIAFQGKKFVKFFKMFMSTLAKMDKDVKENNVSNNTNGGELVGSIPSQQE